MEEKLGAKYVERTRLDLVKAFEESSPTTPIFFILSPGVDALKDLEILGEWPGGGHPALTLTQRQPNLPFQLTVILVGFFFFPFLICWRLNLWKM